MLLNVCTHTKKLLDSHRQKLLDTQTRKIVGRTQTDKEIVGLDTKIVGLLIVAHMGDPQQPLITTAVRP